jgi:hypothetical protein
MKALLCLLALAASAAAQADFLTAAEIEDIRDAQEPNARLETYARFAKQRVDLVRNLLAKDKPGRTILIHQALEAYAKILDAMDDVTDDALARKVDVRKGIAAVERVETDTISTLRRVQETKPKDLDSYSFSLEQAIETASDSLDAARQDLGERTAGIRAREQKEKLDRAAAMAPADGSVNQSAEAKAAQKEQKKAPTLMRPGEKPPDQ